jgi:transcriptional regulator with XRE-family HTH domain
MGHIRGKFREARLLYQGREGRVVTMGQVADAIGVTRQAISDLELGHSLPNHITLAKLCKLYGVQPGDLLVYEDRLSPQPAPALQVQPIGG